MVKSLYKPKYSGILVRQIPAPRLNALPHTRGIWCSEEQPDHSHRVYCATRPDKTVAIIPAGDDPREDTGNAAIVRDGKDALLALEKIYVVLRGAESRTEDVLQNLLDYIEQEFGFQAPPPEKSEEEVTAAREQTARENQVMTRTERYRCSDCGKVTRILFSRPFVDGGWIANGGFKCAHCGRRRITSCESGAKGASAAKAESTAKASSNA